MVVKVIDGDTMWVSANGERFKVRLSGVSAFEVRSSERLRAQALRAGVSEQEALRRGRVARELLAEYLSPGTEVRLVVRALDSRDVYGRVPAVVFLAGGARMSINEALRRSGFMEAPLPPARVGAEARSLYAGP
jgi:endonuclease YncB( thermonuclease family)